MPKEIGFHSDLYQEFQKLIEETDKYEEVEIEKSLDSGKRADLFIEGNLTYSIVVEVKRKSINPLEDDVINQARKYAEELGCHIFVTCNEDTAFVFYREGDEIEFNEYESHSLYTKNKNVEYVANQILQISQSKYSNDSFPNQKERDHALSILSNFQKQFQPSFFKYARNKFESNEQFRTFLIDWCKENGYSDYISDTKDDLEDLDEIIDLYSKQTTYILANRLLLYQIVKRKTPDKIETKSGDELDSITKSLERNETLEGLSEKFDLIQKEIDYEPVFEQEIFPTGQFALDKKSRKNFTRLANGLSRVDIEEIESDFLGEIYEELIPPSERKKLGQFYTHPSIAKTITKWSLNQVDSNSGDLNILDPACGSGTFSVEAYNELNQFGLTHNEAIESISFVDVNPFAINLTAMNMIGKNLSNTVDQINGFEGSYLDIDTGIKTFGSEFNGKDSFDAIIGNPPYIKHQNIGDKNSFRRHLEEFSKDIPKSSDAYIYFITQSTRFLKENGRIGMIIPNVWLMSDYGEPFIDFIHSYYKIESIVGFDSLAFDDADVDTIMLLLEKESDPTVRGNNNINFLYIKDTMEPKDIVSNLDYDYNIEGSWERKTREKYNLTIVNQDHAIKNKGSIKSYLSSPAESIIKLYENENLKDMGEFVSFSRGESPGKSKFFFIDEEDRKKWGISKNMLTPALRSPKYVDSEDVPETNWYILDMSEYISDIKDLVDENEFDKNWVLKKLDEDGYGSLVDYIEYAEGKEWNTTSKCQKRNIWFNVGDLSKYQTTPLAHPRSFHEDIHILNGKSEYIPSDRFYIIDIKENTECNYDVLHGIMNTYLYKLLLETGGRISGGGALQTYGTDLKELSFPDITKLTEKEKSEIEQLSKEGEYAKITDILIDALELDTTVEKIIEDFKTIQSSRTGKDPEVLTDSESLSLE